MAARPSSSSTAGSPGDADATGKPPPPPETPARYLYTQRVAEPNPHAQAKAPSRLSRFLKKFQSPAVKQTTARRDEEKLQEERTGVRVYTPIGAPMGSGAHVANSLGA